MGKWLQDSLEGMTPHSLTPKDEMTLPWWSLPWECMMESSNASTVINATSPGFTETCWQPWFERNVNGLTTTYIDRNGKEPRVQHHNCCLLTTAGTCSVCHQKTSDMHEKARSNRLNTVATQTTNTWPIILPSPVQCPGFTETCCQYRPITVVFSNISSISLQLSSKIVAGTGGNMWCTVHVSGRCFHKW